MKINQSQNVSNINKSTNIKEKKLTKKNYNNSLKDIRFIQTNYYLNDYNFYNKNNLKMNKIRQEKIKEHKKKIDKEKKNNLMPKMLYFNKFIHSETKKFSKNNFKTIPGTHSGAHIPTLKYFSKTNRNDDYKTIKQAIKNKSIELKSKRHIKKTIKAFDDLLQCIDGFKIRNREKRLQMLLNTDDNNNKENNDDDEFNVENYNFDEYKQRYKSEKNKNKNNTSQTGENNDNNSDLQFDENLLNNLQNNNNENIYITAQKTSIEENKKANNNSMKQSKSSINFYN